MKISLPRKFFLAAAGLLLSASAQADVTVVFDWTDPSSLTPAFEVPGPGSLGVYLDGKTITDDGVEFFVDDTEVKEKSRKARFYYGYLTNAVELRVYSNSDIIITAPEGMEVVSVGFTGPEADSEYLTPYAEGAWSGDTWVVAEPARQVRFYSEGRCELSTTTVVCKDVSAVRNLIADELDGVEAWYDLSGRALDSRPTVPGIYLLRRASSVTKYYIR